MTLTPARPSVPAATGSKRISAEQLAALGRRIRVTGEREHADVEKPATGEVLGTVPKCAPEDLEAMVQRARAAQARWRETGWDERQAALLRVHDMILDRREEILDLLQIESGKARRHAFEEILDVALVSRYYGRTAEGFLQPRRRRGAFPVLTATWEYHHPVGVVGIITPWNYPLTLSISDALPALAAGNAVVVKADTQTPFSTLWGAALLEEAGFPADTLQVFTGSGSELGPELIDRVDYIMFTGSTPVGRTVASQAGERLIPSSMELGGKNAMIVFDDADLRRAIEGAERAMFSNAGQLCISMERVLVHEKIADEFTRRMVEHTEAMKLGAELNYGDDMGSLISQDQLDTVRGHIEDAVAKGARVLAGGRARPDIGPYFHEPTLLGDVTENMSLFAEETFGPVAAISTFATEDEAIERANASDYGLNFSVWTRDRSRGRRVATRLKAGTVNVNEGFIAAWGSVDAPMGGMKDSGIGRRHGEEGIRKYTEPQTVAVQRLMPIAPFGPVPQRLWGRAIATGLRILRRLPGYR